MRISIIFIIPIVIVSSCAQTARQQALDSAFSQIVELHQESAALARELDLSRKREEVLEIQVLQLSAIQGVQDLIAEADRLWPTSHWRAGWRKREPRPVTARVADWRWKEPDN